MKNFFDTKIIVSCTVAVLLAGLVMNFGGSLPVISTAKSGLN